MAPRTPVWLAPAPTGTCTGVPGPSLAASASTLVAAWLAYSWTQAHRDGLLFGTRDVATALTGAAVLFAAAAVLGGAARVVRTRELSPWP